MPLPTPTSLALLLALLASGATAQLPTLIRGRLVTPEGAPLAGATVDHEYGWEPAVTTDAAGHFELPHDPDSHARIVLGGRRWARTLVEVPPSGFLGLVTMEPAGLVVGRVVDEDSQPVAGARVTVRDGLRGRLHWRVVDERFDYEASASCDGEGSFRVFGAVRSLCALEVRAPGFAPASRLGATAMEPFDVVLERLPPGRESVERPRLQRGLRAPDRCADLALQIVAAPSGAALPGAEVRVWWRHPSRMRHAPGMEYLPLHATPMLRTDEHGRVTLRGPEAYDAIVEVSATGCGTRRIAVQPTTSRICIELHPGAILRGLLLSKSNGAPLVGAGVYLLPLGPQPISTPLLANNVALPRAASTDSLGSYIVENLPAGPHALYVCTAKDTGAATPLGRAKQTVVLETGETTQAAALTIDPRPDLRIGFPADDGRPDWPVGLAWAADATGRNARETTVAPDADTLTTWYGDHANWFGLPTGPRRIVAWLPQSPRLGAPRPIEVGRFVLRDEPLEFDLRLAALGPRQVTGRFTLTGSPPPRERLVVIAEPAATDGGASFGSLRLFGPAVRLDRRGAFRFRLAPGLWTILLVDAATGVVLHREPRFHATTDFQLGELEVVSHRLEVRCVGRAESIALVDRLEIRCAQPGLLGVGRLRYQVHDGHWKSDRGVGVPVVDGAPLLPVFVPPGGTWIAARKSSGREVLGEVSANLSGSAAVEVGVHAR